MAWAAGLGFTIYSYSTAVQAKKRLYSADLESTDQKKKAQEHFTGIRPRGDASCAGWLGRRMGWLGAMAVGASSPLGAATLPVMP